MKYPNDVNDLINSLVVSFKEFDKSLKNKIRVNSIFSSLDENTTKNFNKLVNLSDLRYKSVKSGVKLNNIIKVQKPKYENLIEELKNDKLYSPNILEAEKAKLFKNSFTFKNKEIYDIRKKLKNSLKLKQHILNFKKKMNPQSKDRKSKLASIIKKVTNSAYLKNFLEEKSKQKKLEKQNEKLLDSLIEGDCKHFNKKMELYHSFLNNIRTISENNKNKKNLKIDKRIFKDTIQSINPNSFRALTYVENSSKREKNLIKKDFEFDIRKIKNIKMSHDKNYNNTIKNKNQKTNENTFNNLIDPNHTLKNKSITSYNFKSNNYSKTINNHKTYDIPGQKKNKSLDVNKLSDFKNTAYIVLNETENGLFNEEKFTTKIDKLNNHYKFFKTYNRINKKQIHDLNDKIIKIPKDIDDEHKKKENILEIKDYNEKNVDLIKRKFQEIYEQKKKKWKKEDILLELKKERDKQNMFEIENFLFEVQDKSLLRKNKIKCK